MAPSSRVWCRNVTTAAISVARISRRASNWRITSTAATPRRTCTGGSSPKTPSETCGSSGDADGPRTTVAPNDARAAFRRRSLAARGAGGRRVRTAAADTDRHWYDPLLAGDAALGRTDPDLDPLGYRTLFALDLLAAHHDHRDLREAVTAPDQVYPETALLSQLDTGAVDAAVVYRSMATDHGYRTVDLPATVDLSDPARADAYADATYDLPGGGTVRGDAIEYGATLRSREDDAARSVFDELLAGDYLDAHGFEVPDAFPRFTRDAPDAVADR